MKVNGKVVAVILAGSIALGTLVGSIHNGYFTKPEKTTTSETNTGTATESEDSQNNTNVTTEETTQEQQEGQQEQTTIQEQTDTYSDTYYTKEEFLSILSNKTNAPHITMEDAGSYLIRNRVGTNNLTNTETYNYNEFIVDGKVIYRDGYAEIDGVLHYFENDEAIYDPVGTNNVFFIGNETTVESRRDVNRDGLFAALREYPDFVSHFAQTEDFDTVVSQYDDSRYYHYLDTKVLNENGGLITDRQDFIVDDETIYGVIWNSDWEVESTYGTYSDNYQKGY